jgi:hypothetical protein
MSSLFGARNKYHSNGKSITVPIYISGDKTGPLISHELNFFPLNFIQNCIQNSSDTLNTIMIINADSVRQMNQNLLYLTLTRSKTEVHCSSTLIFTHFSLTECNDLIDEEVDLIYNSTIERLHAQEIF